MKKTRWITLMAVVLALFSLATAVAVRQAAASTCTVSNGLKVCKDATTSFTRTYRWTLDKSVDHAEWNLVAGQRATSAYTVTVSRSAADSDWQVAGNLSISNHTSQPVAVEAVRDVVTPGNIPAQVSCVPGSIPSSLPAGWTLPCTYSGNLPDGTSRLNTGTFTADGADYSATADVTFGAPTTVVGYESVNITDTNGVSWATSGDATWTYSKEFVCPMDPSLYRNGRYDFTVNNTATIQQTGQSSTASVAVHCTAIYYTLDVRTAGTGHGTVTKNPDAASYAFGTVVTLTATANAGSHFVGWSGDASGSTNPVIITMNGNKVVTATFNLNTPTDYTLTVNMAGTGSGTVTRNPNSATYMHGTVVTLTAIANAGSHFVGWSGDASGSTNPVVITMNGNKVVTARFDLNTPTDYTLTVNMAGTGSGTVTRNPNSAAYMHGTVVTLTANANAGSHFVGWSGDASGSTNPVVITMNGNKVVTATFNLNTPTDYTLTVNMAGTGSGTVTRNPNSATYMHGTVVTLTAIANAGSHFVGWSGDASGSTNPVVITMNGNKVVTARFDLNTATDYTLTVNMAGTGSGTVTRNPNSATYMHGTVVTLTANANIGSNFAGWSGDAIGAANPVVITMDSNKTVTATFNANADLSIALSAKVTYLTSITFTIVVSNTGPGPANGAVLSDTLPANVLNATWTCAASGGAVCMVSSSGQDTLTVFPSGGVITYTVHGALQEWSRYQNMAQVIPPSGIIDPNMSNNVASISRYQRYFPLIYRNSTP